MKIVEGVVNIQAERNAWNGVNNNELPCVLPHELVKLSTGMLGKMVIDPHLKHLKHFWDEKTIAEIENEHFQLCLAYKREPALKSALDEYAVQVNIPSFENA